MAFTRFASLGACQRLVFDSKFDDKQAYLKCGSESKKVVSYYLGLLGSLSSSQERSKVVENNVLLAIQMAQGPLARL
jgi:hypothetical protein